MTDGDDERITSDERAASTTPRAAGEGLRNAAHAELERVRLMLASIVETSDVAVVTVAADGSIASLNRVAERVFGYPASDAVGAPVSILVPARLRPAIEAGLRRHRERRDLLRRAQPFEYVARRRDAVEIPVSISVVPAPDANDLELVVLARDLSHRRHIEEESAVLRACVSAVLRQIAGLADREEDVPPEDARRLGRHAERMRDLVRSLAVADSPEERQRCAAAIEHEVKQMAWWDPGLNRGTQPDDGGTRRAR